MLIAFDRQANDLGFALAMYSSVLLPEHGQLANPPRPATSTISVRMSRMSLPEVQSTLFARRIWRATSPFVLTFPMEGRLPFVSRMNLTDTRTSNAEAAEGARNDARAT